MIDLGNYVDEIISNSGQGILSSALCYCPLERHESNSSNPNLLANPRVEGLL